MKPEHKDRDSRLVVLVLALLLFASIIREAYRTGVEDGYWEHEAEENVYACRTFQ